MDKIQQNIKFIIFRFGFIFLFILFTNLTNCRFLYILTYFFIILNQFILNVAALWTQNIIILVFLETNIHIFLAIPIVFVTI